MQKEGRKDGGDARHVEPEPHSLRLRELKGPAVRLPEPPCETDRRSCDAENFKRARGTAAVTTQTQALADFSLQVRKGNTWPLGVEEDQEGEEGRFWLAKIKDDPVLLGGTMTFAGQVFKAGWVVAKAQYCSSCSTGAAQRQQGSESTSFCRPTASPP